VLIGLAIFAGIMLALSFGSRTSVARLGAEARRRRAGTIIPSWSPVDRFPG
jgi:hypothetical protein